MKPVTIQLKYGPQVITVEPVDNGWQRVCRYHCTLPTSGKNRILTNRSKVYKTERGATKEAEKFIAFAQGKR